MSTQWGKASGKPLFSSVSASDTASDFNRNFPPLSNSKRKFPAAFRHSSASSFTPKRSRTDPKVLAQKSLFAGRKMTSGTNVKGNHGLGSPVTMQPRARMPGRNVVDSFKKSLYVSKLKPSVTRESIAAYVKENVPGIADNMFDLRLLVKKDQNLEELNFISFRLNCDDNLFSKLIDPGFWPSHVMIGEFVERSKPRSSALGDFFVKTQAPTCNPPSSDTPTPFSENPNTSVTTQVEATPTLIEIDPTN